MSNLAKSAFWLMLITMLSKVIGFGREIVLGYFYGTSAYSDIYITALNIPTIVFAIIGTAIGTTFIPLYHEILEKKGKERASMFSSNITGIILCISLFLAIVGFIFAVPLVKLFAISFTGEKLALTVEFVRIMMISVVFLSLSSLMTAFLQIEGQFNIPGMVGFPYNVIVITSIFLSAFLNNIYILAIGGLLGMASKFLFQLFYSLKKGYRFGIKIDLKDEYLKKMLILIIPVCIGVAVNQINTMVDRSLASGLGDGIITALNNANKLNGFVMGLFIITIGDVIYPTLSKLSNENNSQEEFGNSVARCVNCIILLILPISIGAMVLSFPIVRILFERGAFDERSTMLTATALIFYSIGMVGFGLRDILNRVFYSLKDTKTPMINGIIAMVLNIVLNLILVQFIGYKGLALATSLSAIICIVLLFISLKKRLSYFGQDKIKKTFFKTSIAALLMGFVSKVIYDFSYQKLPSGTIMEFFALCIAVLSGIIVYFLLIKIMKVEEIEIFIQMVKKRLKIK